MNFLHHVRGSQNSLGFWIPRCEFQIPGTGFQIVNQWNLDSKSQPFVGFQITWPVLRISKSKIGIPQARISQILDSTSKSFQDSGFPNMRKSFQCTQQGSFFFWSFKTRVFLSLIFEKKNSHKTSLISNFFLLSFLLNTTLRQVFYVAKLNWQTGNSPGILC